jgi:PhoH-like ATPase
LTSGGDTLTKIYVLDTNVLLQDPFALFAFEDNEVVLPAVVLEEIDSKKRNMDEVGRHARHVSRLIDGLREKGKLHEGVMLDNGGFFRVELNHRSFESLKDTFVDRTNDNRIIAVALNLKNDERQKETPREVILVSKDVLVRVKADALGLEAEDFLNDRVVQADDIYKGYREFYVSDELMTKFYSKKQVPVSHITKEITFPFEFFILKGLNNQSSAIGIIDQNGEVLRPCHYGNEAVWGIKARNAQQVMALELLLRKEIQLVTLIGKAGTGKTLLALAAGLLQTEDLRLYKKLLIARSIMPVGKDLGYLPGEKEEKLKPWLQPVYDNLEYLFNTKRKGEIESILAGISSIQTEAITYIRGRSIPEQFMIIDEAQNLTKHEVKTILTRVGEGTKLILMGDPEQVDHPYLDQYNNGLTNVVEKMKGANISGHVKLKKGERSKLAQIAADIL